MDNEEKRIRHAVQSFYDAFNSHHFDAATGYTTEDWTHVNPLGGWTQGREAVLNELKQVHSSFLKGISDNIEEMSVRFATSDVAVVMVPSTLSGTFTTPDGIKHENDRQVRTFVVVRRNDQWLIIHDHNTFRVI